MRDYDESKAGISSVGGVEAVVNVMKAFPKCQALQVEACIVVANFVDCRIGMKKAVEAGAIEFLLAAINNHLDFTPDVSDCACSTLSRIVADSKENIELFISSGGVSTMAGLK
jgi:hypothetical protein